MNQIFHVDQYQVTIYDPKVPGSPVVYINAINGDDYVIWMTCQQVHLPPCIMIFITGLNWDTDMAPWYCPPCGPTDTPCYGGADAYLKILTEQIVPEAEKRIGIHPERRILGGYSLAGLFADYALYHTDLFDETVICSGSFWFPGYISYVQNHSMCVQMKKMYFSLGREECHTPFELFNSVQTNTEALVELYRQKNLDITFVMEPGNHYTDPSGRMARGLAWMLGAPLSCQEEANPGTAA